MRQRKQLAIMRLVALVCRVLIRHSSKSMNQNLIVEMPPPQMNTGPSIWHTSAPPQPSVRCSVLTAVLRNSQLGGGVGVCKTVSTACPPPRLSWGDVHVMDRGFKRLGAARTGTEVSVMTKVCFFLPARPALPWCAAQKPRLSSVPLASVLPYRSLLLVRTVLEQPERREKMHVSSWF